jgi:hypothetical protein
VKNILAKHAGWLLLHFWERPEPGSGNIRVI